ncbi:MAG: asparagine synthase (glutamine-hydrolyzing) [Candidatus Krumholzibacteria bacterium]
MCGIAGIVNSDPDRPAAAETLQRMCKAIDHRGPDDSGTWVEGGTGLGMTRLSIIDVAGGSQPIHNEDRTVWIVYNGEIYNHRELRADLERRGHSFYTQSDTETIVHLYEEFGTDCVLHLRGMFAFAIWDRNRKRLFLARDRLGIKPLHYLRDAHKFLFGSEIKSILEHTNVPREMHPPSLVTYVAYGYVPDPLTMFEGIHKLPPAHTLEYENGQTTIRQYWDVRFEVGDPQPEAFYVEKLLDILSEAVKLRLMSEVPLGAFLSGGTDSSMVVALMAQHMSQPVKTFSIGFEKDEYNELGYARKVAEHFGTDHHEEIVRPDAENVVLDLVRQFDEPFADSSAIPMYYVSRTARKHVTVALSGDGGDELFAGYLRYVDDSRTRLANHVPAALRDPVLLGLAGLLPEGYPGVNFLRNLSGNTDQQYLRRMSKGITTAHENILSDEIRERLKTTDPSPVMMNHLASVEALDDLSRRQYLDTKTYLPGDILTKVDRTSMMVSLEARVPILDHHLVEFAATIPPELKLRGTTTKYIFKKAAERLLTREMIYRPKKGFAVPIKFWLRQEWTGLSADLVLGPRALARNNFRREYLERVMNEHSSGRRDNSSIIWALMVLELWFREKIDGAGGPC